MYLCDLNPHIRFASVLCYTQQQAVKVTDCRLFYILGGSARLQIGESSYRLKPGCLFYCSAGSTYTIHDPVDFSLICMNFDLDQLHNRQDLPLPRNPDPESWPSMPVFFTPVTDSSFLDSHIFMEDCEAFHEPVHGIVSDFSGDSPHGKVLASAQLKALLIRMHHTEARDLPQKIRLVRDYIRQHYREDLSNQFLAQLVGYHEYYLNRVFTASVGTGLHNYLLKQRLTQASYLILNSQLPLTAVSEQVGFKSYPHFSACFKQAYGFSPAQYRKYLRG